MSEEPFALTLHMPPPPAGDFDAIHDAVMETARGRWFLQEYARRHRNADTALVLAAIERIEAALRLQKSTPPPTGAATAPASDLPLMEMRDAIVLTKENLATIKPDGKSDFKAADFERLATAIEAASARMRTAGEHVQEVAWSMREQHGHPAVAGVNESRCAELEAQAREIAKNCTLLEETGAGAKVVAALLQEIEDRINAMLAQSATQDAPARAAETTERPAPIEMPQDLAAGFATVDSAGNVAAGPAPVAGAASAYIAEAAAEHAVEVVVDEAASVNAVTAPIEPDTEPVAAAATIEPLADVPETADELACTHDPLDASPLETVATESAADAAESKTQAGGDVTLVLTETLSIVVTPSAARAEAEEPSAVATEAAEAASANPTFADVTAEIRARLALPEIAQAAQPEPQPAETASVREPVQAMQEPVAAAAEAPSPVEPLHTAAAAGIADAPAMEAATSAPQPKPRGMPGWLNMLAPLVRGRNAPEPAPSAVRIDFRLDGKLVTEATPQGSDHAPPPRPQAQTAAESPAAEEVRTPSAQQTGDEAVLQVREILQGEQASADAFAFQPAIEPDRDSAPPPAPADMISDANAAPATALAAIEQPVASEASAEEPADFLLEPWPRTPVHAQPQDIPSAQAAETHVDAAATASMPEMPAAMDTMPAPLDATESIDTTVPSEPRASNPMSDAIARMAAASRPVSVPVTPVPEPMAPPAAAIAPQADVAPAETQPAGMPAAGKAPPVVTEDDNVLASVIAPTSPLKPIVAKQPFRPIQISKPSDPLAPIVALSEEEKIALFS
jgi:hypothetical protein